MQAFLPGAEPTHREFSDRMDLTIEERQRLHRDLMRCRGFYEFMVGVSDAAKNPAGPDVDIDSICDASQQLAGLAVESELRPEPGIRRLPVVNYLDIGNDEFVDALLEEALPEDRDRYRGYMSRRHLGLGLITAVSLSLPTYCLATCI